MVNTDKAVTTKSEDGPELTGQEHAKDFTVKPDKTPASGCDGASDTLPMLGDKVAIMVEVEDICIHGFLLTSCSECGKLSRSKTTPSAVTISRRLYEELKEYLDKVICQEAVLADGAALLKRLREYDAR
jgi:hypothetical protein